MLNQIFGSPLNGGGAGATGAPLNLLPTPGFAHGGTGRIAGGSGGPDSRLFMAKVNPGEPFAFGPDAMRGGGRTTVIVNAPPGSQVQESRSQIGPDEIVRISIDANKQEMGQGGFDQALGRFGARPTVTKKG